MIFVKITGGLGNQLFQYAFGKAQGIKHAADVALDISSYKKTGNRTYRLDAFTLNTPTISLSSVRRALLRFQTTFERFPVFSKEITEIGKGYFVGNWQSEKYFAHIGSELRKEIVLREWTTEGEKLKTDIENSIKTTPVSLHVRRGDIASDPHLIKKHGTLDKDYYIRAVEKIKETVASPLFYIFSDDVVWVQENLTQSLPHILVSGKKIPDTEELILMSLCSHHIIANSSFSWWGAWLNKKSEKVVIAPKKWFALDTIETRDLIPPSWIQL